MKVRSHKSGFVRLAPLIAGMTAFSMFTACVKGRDDGAGVKTHATPGQVQKLEAMVKGAYPAFDAKNPLNQALAAEMKTAILFRGQDKDDKSKFTVNANIALKEEAIQAAGAVNAKESTELKNSADTAADYKIEAKCSNESCVMVALLVTETKVVEEESLTRTGDVVEVTAPPADEKAAELTPEQKAEADKKAEDAKTQLATYQLVVEAGAQTEEDTASALEAAKTLKFETIEAALAAQATPEKVDPKATETKKEKKTVTRQMVLIFGGSQKVQAKSSKNEDANGVDMKLVYVNGMKSATKDDKKDEQKSADEATTKPAKTK